MMRALARRGVTVLTRRGVLRPNGGHGAPMTRVAGLLVAGFDDPLEWRGRDPGAPERIFSFSELPDPEAAAARADASCCAGSTVCRARPTSCSCTRTASPSAWHARCSSAATRPELTILTGHDHAQHVTSYGSIAVVDAGTVGASGLYGVGRDFVGLGDLHFSAAGVAEAVDLIAVEPVSGAAEARRVLLEDCERRPASASATRGPRTTWRRPSRPTPRRARGRRAGRRRRRCRARGSGGPWRGCRAPRGSP